MCYSLGLPYVLLSCFNCLLWNTHNYAQLVFTKTRILSVKVATLTTFLSMVNTLDQVCQQLSFRHSTLRSLPSDKLDAKTRTSFIQNSHKRTWCYGRELSVDKGHYSCACVWCRWQHCLFRRPWASKSTEKLSLPWFFLSCGQCQQVHVSNLHPWPFKT